MSAKNLVEYLSKGEFSLWFPVISFWLTCSGDVALPLILNVVDTLGTSDANVLFAHFLNFGLWEERQPSALFNVDVYATRNIDLRAAYGDDIVAYYVHYATHPEEIVWRVTPTLSDSYRNGVTIYSVYDMVLGSQYDVKEGAWPVQTATYAPELAMSDNELITYLNDNGLLDEYLASVGQ